MVGFAGDKLFLMPTGEVHGLAPSARVVPRQRAGSVRVGPGLLGRIIDGNWRAARRARAHPVPTSASSC